jgi:type II secretory pathway component PulK
MRRRRNTQRGGFALLAVLWIMVAAASLGLTATFAARESVAAARNRTGAIRAMWRAHDCVERVRVAVASVLEEVDRPGPQWVSPWLVLDSIVAPSRHLVRMPCRVEFRASGSALDVNASDGETVGRLLRAAGVPAARADSMTDALLDWRDADDTPRSLGAEYAWYVAARRLTPRNGALASDGEITLIRDFDSAFDERPLLSVESGRVVLPRAPLAVIAALPGIGEEAIARIAERRLHEAWPRDLVALGAEVSPVARAALLAHYAELSRLTTAEPDAWIVTSRARDGSSPAVTAAIEVRLVRAGTRAAIVRRRSWVE